MIEDYENGITPNPDVICNREIKFGWFLDKCLESINDNDKENTWIATGIIELPFNTLFFFFCTNNLFVKIIGHYVQLERTDSGRVKLMRGVYFL